MTGHAAEVRRAAAELGVTVPSGFLYLGDGEAMVVGTAEQLLAAAAILDRLRGVPVADCWPAPSPREPDPRPFEEQLADYYARGGPRIYMSWQTVQWAMDKAPMLRTEKDKPDTTARAILVVLAEYAEVDGTEVYPSVPSIEYRTGYSRRAVQEALRRLEDGKLIEAVGSRHGNTEWMLCLHQLRPASDREQLDGKTEARRAATRARVARHRARRVTPSDGVTDTPPDGATEPDVTPSDSVSNAVEQRSVTPSDAPYPPVVPVIEKPGKEVGDARRASTGSSARAPRGGSAASSKTSRAVDDRDTADAIRAVYAALPDELRRLESRPLPAGPPLNLRNLISEQLRHRTAQQLAERTARRWVEHGWAEKVYSVSFGEELRGAVGVATALLRSGECPDPRCEDGTNVDAIQPCRSCPERRADYWTGRRAAAAGNRNPEPEPVPAQRQTADGALQWQCTECEAPGSGAAPDGGLCSKCRQELDDAKAALAEGRTA